MRLVRDLNDRSRFVLLPLGEGGNPSGAEAVLAWQTGYGEGVDLARGFPRSLPEAARLLDSGGFDARVVVADDPRRYFDPDFPTAIPTVVIGPGRQPTRPGPALGRARLVDARHRRRRNWSLQRRRPDPSRSARRIAGRGDRSIEHIPGMDRLGETRRGGRPK